eukprot:gene45049-61028_t
MKPLDIALAVSVAVIWGVGFVLSRFALTEMSSTLLTATFMDYALPRAIDIPNFHFETRNVRCVTNALGVKGAGEAGAIGACPAVMNAMVDALDPPARKRLRAMGVTIGTLDLFDARLLKPAAARW